MIGSKNIAKAEPRLERGLRAARLPAHLVAARGLHDAAGPRDLAARAGRPGRRRRLVALPRVARDRVRAQPTGRCATTSRCSSARTWLCARGRSASRRAPAPPPAARCPVSSALAQRVIEGPFDGRPLARPGRRWRSQSGRPAPDRGHRRAPHRRARPRRRVRARVRQPLRPVEGRGGRLRRSRRPGAAGRRATASCFEPWGVAEGPDGGTLVADTWNGRVVLVRRERPFRAQLGAPLDRLRACPSDRPALRPARHRVRRATGGGSPWPTPGTSASFSIGRTACCGASTGPRQARPAASTNRSASPSAANGSLYVADAWNRRIQRFDAGARRAPASGR